MHNLESLFKKVEPVLNDIGLDIPDIPINFLDEQNWNSLLKERNIKEAEGVFIPKDCSVFLPKDNFSLPVFIHEYFGHGLFMKNSEIGKKIVSLEEELEKTSDETIKEKLITFFNKNLMIYESFAVWVEDFLLTNLEEEELLRKRLEHVNKENPKVYENYIKLKNFEEKKGPLSLLLKLGFSKDLDNNLVLRLSEENLRTELNNINLIILYGSKKGRRDIDLLVVYSNDCSDLNKHHFLGEVDITRIKQEELITRLKLFDIEVTEPVLNGEVIKGSTDEFLSLKRILKNSDINDKTFIYNNIKSVEMYNYGLNFLNKSRFERTNNLVSNMEDLNVIKNSISDIDDFESLDLLYSLVNISYGFSYLSSLNRLKEGQKIIKLKDIINNPVSESDIMLRKTISYIKNVKSEKDKLSYIKTKMIFDYLHNIILFNK